ncbi:MAG: MoaD/ThiS family protein [Thiolinea sp.]
MSIKVLFFASLREQVGKSQAEAEWQEGLTAGELWRQTSGQDRLPDNVLIACNQQYCSHDTLVGRGDEVAFSRR